MTKPMDSDATERLRDGAGELVDRAQETGNVPFSEDRNYLSRYQDENGNVDPDRMAQLGVNRLLYFADQLAAEDSGRKPLYVHLVTGFVELFLVTADERSRDR